MEVQKVRRFHYEELCTSCKAGAVQIREVQTSLREISQIRQSFKWEYSRWFSENAVSPSYEGFQYGHISVIIV